MVCVCVCVCVCVQQVFNALTEFLKQISEVRWQWVSGLGVPLGDNAAPCSFFSVVVHVPRLIPHQITSEEEFEERVNFIPMTEALVIHTGSDDKFTRETAMEWLSKFIKLGANKMIVVLDKLIAAVLRCLSSSTVCFTPLRVAVSVSLSLSLSASVYLLCVCARERLPVFLSSVPTLCTFHLCGCRALSGGCDGNSER